jgi:hypothetical protein
MIQDEEMWYTYLLQRTSSTRAVVVPLTLRLCRALATLASAQFHASRPDAKLARTAILRAALLASFTVRRARYCGTSSSSVETDLSLLDAHVWVIVIGLTMDPRAGGTPGDCEFHWAAAAAPDCARRLTCVPWA